MDFYAAVPAKLVKLKRGLKKDDLDTDMDNYNRLGEHASIHGKYWQCSRLIKNLTSGVLGEPPKLVEKCKCGQDIVYNCIIQHIHEKYIVVIGSCCYAALTSKEQRMEMCSIKGCFTRHQNRNYTVCNKHKIELQRQERVAKQASAREAKLREREKEVLRRRVELYGNRRFGFGRTFYNTPINGIPDWYIKWIKKEQIDNRSTRMLLKYCETKRYLNQ